MNTLLSWGFDKLASIRSKYARSCDSLAEQFTVQFAFSDTIHRPVIQRASLLQLDDTLPHVLGWKV
jgi:hypothetical protein